MQDMLTQCITLGSAEAEGENDRGDYESNHPCRFVYYFGKLSE